jgi:mRNA interferase MazF
VIKYAGYEAKIKSVGKYDLKGNKDMIIKRGDIFYADLSPVVGSEQGGLRPVLIVQNDVGNRHSPTVIAAAITSKTGKNHLPTHIDISRKDTGDEDALGLAKDSVILLEQIRTIDKRRLKEKMGHLDEKIMKRVNDAILVSIGLASEEGISASVGSEEPSSEDKGQFIG